MIADGSAAFETIDLSFPPLGIAAVLPLNGTAPTPILTLWIRGGDNVRSIAAAPADSRSIVAKNIARPGLRGPRCNELTTPRIVATRLKPVRKGNPEGWVANYEGFDDTAMWGMGKTEAAAIAQLKEIWPLEASPAEAGAEILPTRPRPVILVI